MACLGGPQGNPQTEGPARSAPAHSVASGEHPLQNQMRSHLPGFFLANDKKSGKRPLANPEVMAFGPLQQGRVLFTSNGAFFTSPVTGERPHSKFASNHAPAVQNRWQRPSPGRQVVFKAGWHQDVSRKRPIMPVLEHPIEGKINYFVGPKTSWRSSLKAYQRLVYAEVWEGVDLVYLGARDKLAFQLELAPGAFWQAIALDSGAQDLEISPNGDLIAINAGAKAMITKPKATQIVDGRKRSVPVAFRLLEDGQYGFEVAQTDPNYAMTIQVEVVWGTYLGGPGGAEGDVATGVAIDGDGNTYVAGHTLAGDFPTTSGSLRSDFLGKTEVFIVKINPTGTALEYATFLGGSGDDFVSDIEVNSSGQVMVTGMTSSEDFPVTAMAAEAMYQGGFSDAFAAKLSSDGSSLVYATYLGGSEDDGGEALALDDLGNAVVVGWTESSDFATTGNAIQATNNGIRDCFTAILASDGALTYSSYFGGSSLDYPVSVGLDASGNISIAGFTFSTDFPLPPTADQTLGSSPESGGAFVCKLNDTATTLTSTMFVDGRNLDMPEAFAVAPNGESYLTGITRSPDFPTTPGAYGDGQKDPGPIFISKLGSDGSSLVYSARLPGFFTDISTVIQIDALGQATIAGKTDLVDFPTTKDAYDVTLDGFTDAFVVQLNAAGSQINFGTFLGGSSSEQINALALDPNGQLVVVGATESVDFPVTPGAIQPQRRAFSDAFITKFTVGVTDLVYSTYLGGSGEDTAICIATDAASNVYVAGHSHTGNFPTTPGALAEQSAGGTDVYIAKLNPTGSELLFATYLGGGGSDSVKGLVVDRQGYPFVAGGTSSADFPTTEGVVSATQPGFSDVYVTKLNQDGTALEYSTFLGTPAREECGGIAVDSQGYAYVCGVTDSPDFPTTSGVLQPQYSGSMDLFVLKLTPAGDQLVFSSFLGGDELETAEGISLGPNNQIYLAGRTRSTSFPTTALALDRTLGGSFDGFIAKLNPSATFLAYSTFLGGDDRDWVYALAVDKEGHVFATGYTDSDDFPVTEGAFRTTGTGTFVIKLDTVKNQLHYSTFIGPDGNTRSNDIAVNAQSEAMIVGQATRSFDSTFCAPISDGNFAFRGFISHLNQAGTGLLYSTVIQGNDRTEVLGVALDPFGSAYLAGFTRASDIPTTDGVLAESQQGKGGGFILKLDSPTPVRITPVSQALGLTPPVFQVVDECGIVAPAYQWRTDPPTAILDGGAMVTLDPAPFETTRVDVSLTNETGSITTRQATLLVAANALFFDFNADGCNNLQDLWDLTEFWNQPFAQDPDGNGFLDVRDLLFLNLDDPMPCP